MNKKILIVDDEPIFAYSLRKMLQKNGYYIIGLADSYQKALELFESEKPDLIIMDIHLRGKKDGIETVGEIHKQKKVPVIFLSSTINPEIIKRAKAVENCTFIAKPDDDNFMDTLNREITDILTILVKEN